MDVLQVIAEPNRRQILGLIWERELPVTDIASHFDVTLGAVSQHLAVLRKHSLVSVRKDGNRRLYRADQDVLAPFRGMLETMWAEWLEGLAAEVEQSQGNPQ